MWPHFPSRPTTLLSADNGVIRPSKPYERLILGERIVLSRSLCHFETMARPPGGINLRTNQAVQLAAKSRTPIGNPSFFFEWHEDLIGVWSWPQDLVSEIPGFEGEILPETVLQPLQDHGSRLVKTLEGFEGQIWRNGALIASRWWPNEPDSRAWGTFARAGRIEPDHNTVLSMPAPIELERLTAPETQPHLLHRLQAFWPPRMRDCLAAALIAVAAPILFLAGQWINLALTQTTIERELSVLTEQTSEINQARENAQTAARQLTIYTQELNQRHPSATMASVTQELSAFAIQLNAFEQSGTTLTVRMSAESDFAPDVLVRAMESNELLNNVRLEPGRGQREWILNATLERPQ